MYLFPYNNRWPSDYLVEKKLILDACASHSGHTHTIQLIHIGSTAIAGMYSKDCIDILGIVDKISDTQRMAYDLSTVGYDDRGSYGIEGRAYFSKNKRKAHLHVFRRGDINIDKHIKFVKIMRRSPELVSALNTLKTRLHIRYPNDKERYQEGKAFFYRNLDLT